MITIVRVSPRRAALVSLLGLALVACGDRARSDGRSAASAPAAATAAAPKPSPKDPSIAPSSESAAPSATSTAQAAIALPPGSVGTGAGDCRLLRGPAKLSTSGAVLIGPGSGGLAAFATNRLGAPAWETPKFPEASKRGPPALLPRPFATPAVPLAQGAPSSPGASAKATAAPAPTAIASASPTVSASAQPSADASAQPSDDERTRLPACAFAGGFTFCSDADGQIHRRSGSGEDDKIVAKGRRSTPVTAAAVGGHTYYAFLANQRTTEGVILRAFASVDDETPIPLSEDGSGATFVGLVARDDDVLAMYIDARSALTPVHARTLRFEGRLVRGADAVVHVGGSSDGRVRGAIGRGASGPSFLFVTGTHEDNRYGVVTIPIEGEPKDDLPGKWSFYPAAITTSPLAATAGKTPLRLARIRPETKEPDAGQVVEIGHVDPSGAFSEKCVIAKGPSFSDVGVAVDERGSLWISYTNGQGTWVEQRGE